MDHTAGRQIDEDDPIPFETRAHWMRATNQLLTDMNAPCQFLAYGTVIVNHTVPGLGEVVCSGINQNFATGNPTLHGEFVAIRNCTEKFTAQNGIYRYTPEQAMAAFTELSLYTNSEACPMCASAIRWTGFKEYIFGTFTSTLIESGWTTIDVYSKAIFDASEHFPDKTRYMVLLSNETDPFFKWQYNTTYPCPPNCQRSASRETCEPIQINSPSAASDIFYRLSLLFIIIAFSFYL